MKSDCCNQENRYRRPSISVFTRLFKKSYKNRSNNSVSIFCYNTPHMLMKPEQRHYAGYAQDLRERFQKGMLSELTPYPHFVVWQYTVEQGKLKKRPFQPKTNLPAKTNDPSTWTDIDPALKALATGRYNGIGFVFAETDPFIGTDLDNCVGKDGTIAS